jgi:hypothetical protein
MGGSRFRTSVVGANTHAERRESVCERKGTGVQHKAAVLKKVGCGCVGRLLYSCSPWKWGAEGASLTITPCQRVDLHCL